MSDNLHLNFIMGAIAGCGAVTFTNPFDVAKTRLQLQGELRARGEYTKTFNGVLDTIYKTAKHEGLLGAQKGLLAAYCFQVVMNGTRLGMYETLKNLVKKRTSIKENNTPLNILQGGLSGFAGGFIGTPFQLVKTRIQSNSFAVESPNYRYKGVRDGLRSIHAQNGFKGFYSGAYIFAMRTGIGSSVQLPSYDFIKHELIELNVLKDDFHIYVVSSVGASILACLVMNPFDCVSTRVFNQQYSQGEGDKYKGFIDCFAKTIKAEGIRGLYKGLTAQVARLAPHTILAFNFLEYLKKSAGKMGLM